MTDIAAVIADAKSKLGARYVWGAEGPNTFDCSGLVQWAFGRHGVKLPRVAADQAKVGQEIPWDKKQPGDLIFTTWDKSPDVDHVGIYLGNNQYINAPHTGAVVRINSTSGSFRNHVTGVRRVANNTGGGGGGVTLPGLPDIGLPGLPGTAGLVGAIQGVADGVRDAAGGLVSVGALATQLAKLALPSSQVRIASGALGVGFIAVGIFFLVREVRS